MNVVHRVILTPMLVYAEVSPLDSIAGALHIAVVVAMHLNFADLDERFMRVRVTMQPNLPSHILPEPDSSCPIWVHGIVCVVVTWLGRRYPNAFDDGLEFVIEGNNYPEIIEVIGSIVILSSIFIAAFNIDW